MGFPSNVWRPLGEPLSASHGVASCFVECLIVVFFHATGKAQTINLTWNYLGTCYSTQNRALVTVRQLRSPATH